MGLHFRFDLQPGAKPKLGSGDRDEALTGLLQNLSLEGFGPKWTRPLPPRLLIQDEARRHALQINYQSKFLDFA